MSVRFAKSYVTRCALRMVRGLMPSLCAVHSCGFTEKASALPSGENWGVLSTACVVVTASACLLAISTT